MRNYIYSAWNQTWKNRKIGGIFPFFLFFAFTLFKFLSLFFFLPNPKTNFITSIVSHPFLVSQSVSVGFIVIFITVSVF